MTWMQDARIAAVFAMALAMVAAPSARAADGPPPVEVYFRYADMSTPVLSPSGRRIAVGRAVGAGRKGLAVIDLQDLKASKVVASFTDADVFRYWWVGDDRLVYDLVDRTKGRGKETVGNALFVVGADGSDNRQLIEGMQLAFSGGRGNRLRYNHRLLDVPQDGRDEVIVGRADFDAGSDVKSVTPLRLDVTTGRTRSVAIGAPDYVTGWWFDPAGEPRVATSQRNGRLRVYWRAPGQEAWKMLTDEPELRPSYEPHTVDAAGNLYVTTSDGAGGTARLKRFDFAKNAPQPEPLVSTPGFDFYGRLLFDRQEPGKVLGVRFTTDAESVVWFEPRRKAIQETVDKKLPGRANLITCRRCAGDDAVVLVESSSDREPGEYWLYEPLKDRWQPIGRSREDVDPRRSATLDIHRIKARDGLELPVWVTTPAGGDAKKPRPAVVLLHGGPWVRGPSWEWDGEAQFLASRGYVVIEPQFRGSLGYGDDLFRASFKQWGRAMQDDVADVTQWAVKSGIADPGRICLAGASYGGYATLMGLIRHGDMYRCGIAWVAVTDPRLLFELSYSDVSEAAKAYTLRELIGDPKADAAALAAVAPVELADKLKAPLLLAFGGEDVRVPIAHGNRMRSALRAAGNEPEWLVYPTEGHGWFEEKNRYDWARRMEAFLAKHLK